MPREPTRDLDATEELLVLAARVHPPPSARDRIARLLERRIDWDRFDLWARYHRVGPLAYRTLSRYESAGMPRQVLRGLSKGYFECAARNMSYAHALGQVLCGLQKKDVRAVVLKGAALAGSVYGNLALRPMSDIDLLVRVESIGRVDRVLRELGYAPPADSLPVEYYRCNHFHVPYRNDAADVKLEIHWKLQEDLGLTEPDTEELWRGAVPFRVAGAEGLQLGLEDLVVHLCLHLHKHGYYNSYLLTCADARSSIVRNQGANALIWICDLSTLVSQYEETLDWGEIVNKAKRWGAEDSVYSSLGLVGRFYGPSRAEVVLERLQPQTVRAYERGLYRRVLRLESEATANGGLENSWKHRLLQMDPVLQFRPVRLFGLLRYLFPERSVLARRYGTSGWWPLKLGLHLVRTASRLTRALARYIGYSLQKRLRRVAPEGKGSSVPENHSGRALPGVPGSNSD